MLVSLRNSFRFNNSRSQTLRTIGTLAMLSLLCLAATTRESSAHEPEAEAKAQQAHSTDATQAYATAAQAQNAREYKQAAELWNDFIDQNKDDGLVSQAQHHRGVCLMKSDDLPGAREAFSASLKGLIDRDEKCECREDTFITLGWVHYLLGVQGEAGEVENATDVLGQYLLAYPKGEWVDQALFYRGEALVHRGKLKKGIESHSRLIKEFPESPLRAPAVFAAGTGNHDLGNVEPATELFDLFLKEFPDHALISDVAFRRAQLHSAVSEFTKAAELFALAGTDTKFRARDQALFQAGYCNSVSGDFETAADAYAKVADECRDSPLAAQACLDAGRCLYESKQYGMAVVRLEQSLEGKDVELVLQTRHWLCRVDLSQQRFQAGGKEAQRGLRWIEENAEPTHKMRLPLLLDYAESLEGMPDQKTAAMETFISLVDEYPDSKVAPRALFRAFRIAVILDDKDKAKSLTERFTSNYPDHELLADVRSLNADASLATGDPALAESQLQQLMAENERLERSIALGEPSVPAKPNNSFDQFQLSESTLESKPSETAATAEKPKASPDIFGPAMVAPSASIDDSAAATSKKVTDAADAAEANPVATVTATPPITNVLPLKLGHSLFLQKKYKQSITTLSEFADVEVHTPEHSQAFYLMGTSHHYLGQHKEAFKSLSSALVCDPNGKHAPQVCVRMAQSLTKMGRISDAKKVLARVILVFPKSDLREQSLLQLAELEYASRKHDAALLRYKQLLKEYPTSQWANRAAFGVARVAIRKNEPDRALKLLDKLLEKDTDESLRREILLLRAASLQKKDDHVACLKDLEDLIATAPVGDIRSDALLLSVPSHIETAHPGLARQCLKSILDDNPAYPRKDQVLYQLAWLAKREGDSESAFRQFGALAATLPKSPHAAEANYHLGEAAFLRNRIKEALPFYATAAKTADKDELVEKSVHRLAWCYFHLRDYADAESVLNKQLERFPNGRTTKIAKFLKAECMFMQSDYSAAFEQYKLVADGEGLTAKQEALVYLHGGQTAGKLKKWVEAERWLTQIHMKFKDSEYAPVAYWEMAQLLRKQERMDDAQSALRRSAQASKSEISARAQYDLAKIARTDGKVGLAYREFQVLMYGYGGKLATPEVKRWQVEAALQAADCAATKARDAFRSEEEKYLRQAEKCLQFVIDEDADSEKAKIAARRMANLVDQFNLEPLQR